MKTSELLKKYPKVTELIKKWHLEKLKLSLNSPEIDDEFKNQIKINVITDEVITKVIDSNPHAYFEMFDNNKIYIEIMVCETDNEICFKGHIQKFGREVLIESFKKRIEAERSGLEKAFELLEKKL